MQIYLPVAEIPVNIFLILFLGLLTGFLAGMFGIGGGFLATPLLMFIGISPAIAVSTSVNQITASSVSGVLAHWKKGNVDIKMGIILLIGGLFGSSLGVWIFSFLQKLGQIDIVIAFIYILFLGVIGILMMIDSIKTFLKKKYDIDLVKENSGTFVKKLSSAMDHFPYKTYFPKSNIEVSIIVPLFIGSIVGILVSIMGIGGGFIMIPAMFYILKMPSNVLVGTSLFQIMFTTANATFLQAVNNYTVDIVLSFLMIVSSVIGAQIGIKAAHKIDADNVRSILSLMILIVCIKMLFNLFLEPQNLYTLE